MYDIHSGGVSMNSLEIKNVTKKYESFTLDNVSFEIPKGYIMGFIGENGAGKTTTIKSILNIVNRESGSVSILGLDIDKDELEIKKRIGYVSGDVFYPKRRIKEITNGEPLKLLLHSIAFGTTTNFFSDKPVTQRQMDMKEDLLHNVKKILN